MTEGGWVGEKWHGEEMKKEAKEKKIHHARERESWRGEEK